MEPGARKAARDAELRPLMEDFGGMGAGQLPLASPKLALHRALQYAVEFWPYVMNVLEDGHLELSNNVAEQAQRIFVVGRKNWLFSDAPRGARASAAIYSVTTKAKEMPDDFIINIDPDAFDDEMANNAEEGL